MKSDPGAIPKEGVMSKEIKADKYEIEVIFTPEKISTDPFTYRVDGGEEKDSFELEVRVPLAWVELKLREGTGAAFTTTPIQWIFDQAPVPTPPQFSVQRRNKLEIMILNINEAGQEKQRFGFEIAVMYQGKTYTSPDPTIINVDPTQGVPLPLNGQKTLSVPVAA